MTLTVFTSLVACLLIGLSTSVQGHGAPSHGPFDRNRVQVADGFRRQTTNQNGHHHYHHYYGEVHNHFAHGDDPGHHGRGDSGRHDSHEHGRHQGRHDSHEHSHEGRHGHHSSHGHDDDHDAHSDDRPTIYRFQIGENFGPYEYIDENDGVLKGFHIDLLLAVCAEAKKECRWVLDVYTNCWDTAGDLEIPGVGLLADYYDGCIGLTPSPERLNSFNFTASYTPNFVASMHYRAGDLEGDPADLTGKRVGFVNGWAVGKKCLSMQSALRGNRPGLYTPVMFEAHEKMIMALQSEEVDSVLTAKAYVPAERLGLQAAGPEMHCTSGGIAVMVRYSKQYIIDWWNEAFERLRERGDFRRLCEKARIDHAHRGTLFCLDD